MAANEIMPGRVQINATIPDDAAFGPQQVQEFWGKLNIPIASINHCHSRGGHLTDINLTGRYGRSSSRGCGIIARHNFIAWDGRVLSCCHDLHADNVHGHVSEDDFLTIARRKQEAILQGPQFKICRNCTDTERLSMGQALAVPLVQIGENRLDAEETV